VGLQLRNPGLELPRKDKLIAEMCYISRHSEEFLVYNVPEDLLHYKSLKWRLLTLRSTTARHAYTIPEADTGNC
jgi:hypothetical protein